MKRQYRVLVADDDPGVLRLLSMALSRTGMECDTAEDGVRAQNMVRVGRYDAIVSDLAMPRLHGHRLLTNLLAERHPAVLFGITGVLEPKLAADLVRRGVCEVFTKPVDPPMFAAIVQAHLQRRAETARTDFASADKVSQQIEAATASLKGQLKDVASAFEETIEHLERKHEQLEDRLLGSIRLMSKLLGQVGEDQGSHASRVERMAMGIARREGLDVQRLRNLRAAALLHELGQFGLPDNVRITPPWDLKGSELEAYRKYPEIGATLLSEVEGTEDVVSIIEVHCETFNGTGFPRGLKGEEIELEGRILRLADGIDTLRMYRKSDNLLDDIKRHLLAESGKLYDPHLVKLAVAAVTDQLSAEIETESHGLAVEQVKPGMQLASDLYSPDDQLLARAGATITPNMLDRLRKLIPGRTVYVEQSNEEAAPAQG